MPRPITSEIVEAYAHCPRKAFLLLRGGQEAAPHEYQQIIDEQEAAARQVHRVRLEAEGAIAARGPEDLAAGPKVVLDAVLTAGGHEARCDALRKVRADSAFGHFASSRPNSTFLRTLSHGNRAESWNITSRSGPGPFTALPSTVTAPASGCSRPATRLSSVDLPQPDGPSRQMNSPSPISRSTSLSA